MNHHNTDNSDRFWINANLMLEMMLTPSKNHAAIDFKCLLNVGINGKGTANPLQPADHNQYMSFLHRHNQRQIEF